MSKDNGGPAFPLHNHGVQTLGMHLTGMTLRDHFAGLVLQGFIASPDCGWLEEELPHRAYEIADAMLKVREAK